VMADREEPTARFARLDEQIKSTRERGEATAQESLRRFTAIKEQFKEHDAQDAKRFDAIDKALDALRETLTKNRIATATLTATLASVGALVGSLVSHFLLGGH